MNLTDFACGALTGFLACAVLAFFVARNNRKRIARVLDLDPAAAIERLKDRFGK